jgi:hypothetical protein
VEQSFEQLVAARLAPPRPCRTLAEAVAFGVEMKGDKNLLESIEKNGFYLGSPPTTAKLAGDAEQAFLAVARTFLSAAIANNELTRGHKINGREQNVNRHQELLLALDDKYRIAGFDVCKLFSSEFAAFNLVVRRWKRAVDNKEKSFTVTAADSDCYEKLKLKNLKPHALQVDVLEEDSTDSRRFTLLKKTPQ